MSTSYAPRLYAKEYAGGDRVFEVSYTGQRTRTRSMDSIMDSKVFILGLVHLPYHGNLTLQVRIQSHMKASSIIILLTLQHIQKTMTKQMFFLQANKVIKKNMHLLLNNQIVFGQMLIYLQTIQETIVQKLTILE